MKAHEVETELFLVTKNILHNAEQHIPECTVCDKIANESRHFYNGIIFKSVVLIHILLFAFE